MFRRQSTQSRSTVFSSTGQTSGNSGSNYLLGIFIIIALVGLVSLIFYLLFPIFKANVITPFCYSTHARPICGNGIGPIKVEAGQDTVTVGISDGSFAFDTSGSNGTTKVAAATAFSQGNISGALSQWNQAIAMNTSDAESQIYRNDLSVSGSYVTVIVATTLSRVVGDDATSISVGRDDLRGACMAQIEYNTTHKLNGKQIRLLIANLGAKNTYDKTEYDVLEQIIQFAKSDPTFIGVMGFPFSAEATMAVPILAKEHIPIISPSASSNRLTGSSPYFFRVIPPDVEQGADGAQFATDVLHVHDAVVFFDPQNPYSQSLGDSFASAFRGASSQNTVQQEEYTVGQPDTFLPSLHTVLNQSPAPNLIFFAGYADDLNVLRGKVFAQSPNTIVMGGDASYELGGYDRSNYAHFYFTGFTYPDTWDILCKSGASCNKLRPAFVDDYIATFDPNHQHPGEYGYARTGPHAILAYDASTALLEASDSAINSSGGTFSLADIRNALQNTAFQGVSGHISFQGNNPTNKTVVVICVDSQHLAHLVATYGQFVDSPDQPHLYPSTSVCS